MTRVGLAGNGISACKFNNPNLQQVIPELESLCVSGSDYEAAKVCAGEVQ